MTHFKFEKRNIRNSAGACNDIHIATSTYKLGDNLSATVNSDDYANIVTNLQSAVCLNVARRVACPAHDARLWSEIPVRKLSIWRIFEKILLFIVSIFYIILPPWPTRIFRKIVFCAPQRGKYYYLIGIKGGKTKTCFSASEAVDMDHLSICLPQMVKPKVRAIDVFYHLLRCKVFTLPYNARDRICVMELYCEQSIRWLHRDKNRKKVRSPNLIIFSQPNSSDLGCCLMMDPNFADIGDFLQCDLLIFDYPGYGISEGKTTEKNVYDAIDAVMKHAIEVLGYSSEQIILIGFSLGTAAMIHAAENFKVAAVVLIAPFTSFYRIISRNPSLASPWFDMFPSFEKAHRIQSPTLICHGERDFLVSHKHGEQLKSIIVDSELYLLKMASHQGIFCEREMWDKVEEFLGSRVGITRKWIEYLQTESDLSNVTEVIGPPVPSHQTFTQSQSSMGDDSFSKK